MSRKALTKPSKERFVGFVSARSLRFLRSDWRRNALSFFHHGEVFGTMRVRKGGARGPFVVWCQRQVAENMTFLLVLDDDRPLNTKTALQRLHRGDQRGRAPMGREPRVSSINAAFEREIGVVAIARTTFSPQRGGISALFYGHIKQHKTRRPRMLTFLFRAFRASLAKGTEQSCGAACGSMPRSLAKIRQQETLASRLCDQHLDPPAVCSEASGMSRA